jgi:fructose-specific phosphotransferase system IIA component
MTLIDIITEQMIKVPLISQTKIEIVKELVQLLKDAGKIDDMEATTQAIMQREAQCSTGLENGIAVPHAKCNEVKSLTIAIGISPRGMDFQAIDGKPSHLFFLLLAPPDQSGPHIEALAEIARMTRSPSFCNLLMQASTAKEVISLFKEE